ncbi:hypothetical protein D3C71_2015930 [compost metagenome]
MGINLCLKVLQFSLLHFHLLFIHIDLEIADLLGHLVELLGNDLKLLTVAFL